MLHPTIPRLHTVLPLIAAVLLAGVIGLTVFLSYEYTEETSSLRNGLEVQKNLAQLLSAVQDAEADSRGFLLTGDNFYLEFYRKAVSALPSRVAALKSLTAGNPQQQGELEELLPIIEARIARLEESISLRRTKGLQAAVEFVRSKKGYNIMSSIYDRVARLQDAETNILYERTARAHELVRMGGLAALGAIFIVLLTIMAWIWTIRRDARLLAAGAREREAVEEQNRQLQKMEAVGQLTGGIAHDFNNMLAVVISGLSIIKRRIAAGNMDVAEIADATMDGANRAALLTSRLMAFSRQQPLSPAAIDSSGMLRGMADLINRALGELIQVEFHLPEGAWLIHADPSQLESAVLNLCVNARDAMPHGGKLTIETHNTEIGQDLARQMEVPPGQYVSISVTDTGEGMPADVAARAFDPFFTTKGVGKGTGLGLSQVQGFVRQSKGYIKIYSEPGQGTSVKIYLPRHAMDDAPPAVPAAARAGSGAAHASPDHLILVVEDDAQVRRLTVSMLRDLGYRVKVADGAAVALRLLEENPEITLMFTDVVMPETNGRQLADMALKRWPHLKVLYTTGFTRNAIIHGGRLDADINFIAKPFSLDQLAKKISSVLSQNLESARQ